MIYKVFQHLWYQHLFVTFIAPRAVTDSNDRPTLWSLQSCIFRGLNDPFFLSIPPSSSPLGLHFASWAQHNQ